MGDNHAECFASSLHRAASTSSCGMVGEDLTVSQVNTGQQSAPPRYTSPSNNNNQSNLTAKYSKLLKYIEELGRDIRPSYTGNKVCAERLKRSVLQARVVARECVLEVEGNLRP